MLKRILAILFVLMIIVPFSGIISASGSGSTNWLSGWTYRKAHVINGSSASVQTNYPVEIDVHYSFGFDVGSDVYLDYKCRTDFGDVRFTDASGVNVLSDYIEQEQNGVEAVFWVSVPYIPQSPNNATIHIYYGNPNATTTSNRNLVFPLASDFEDGTDQGWTITWNSYTGFNGVSTTNVFRGNY